MTWQSFITAGETRAAIKGEVEMVNLPIVEGESFRGYAVPHHIQDGIARYINHGDAVGGFLTAFLDNDLKDAFARADETNAAAMLQIVKWFWNCAPSACWGGRSKREAWQAQGGALGPRT